MIEPYGFIVLAKQSHGALPSGAFATSSQLFYPGLSLTYDLEIPPEPPAGSSTVGSHDQVVIFKSD